MQIRQQKSENISYLLDLYKGEKCFIHHISRKAHSEYKQEEMHSTKALKI